MPSDHSDQRSLTWTDLARAAGALIKLAGDCPDRAQSLLLTAYETRRYATAADGDGGNLAQTGPQALKVAEAALALEAFELRRAKERPGWSRTRAGQEKWTAFLRRKKHVSKRTA